MTAWMMRVLFLLACAGIGLRFSGENNHLMGIVIGLVCALIIIGLEFVLSKRPIQSIGAIVFGLITGSIIAILFNYILQLANVPAIGNLSARDQQLLITLSLAVASCYLCVMVIYRTRDRFRFIIPYVEFQKEEKGARPVMIDTSAVIDGRLAELCETRLFDTTLIIPKFVLQELQHVADSADRLRRNRGRRGLEMLQRLQRDERLAIQIHDGRTARGNTVDSKLVSLAGQLQARILTCDYNLAKFAELQNVETINLNEIANALRPTVLAGEERTVQILRPGDEAGQGVGYLQDGTMVVVEGGRGHIGESVNVVVTSTLQTSAGRMVFARIRAEHGGGGEKQAEEKDPPKKPAPEEKEKKKVEG
jgi:uncharacterized protein YacL